ncbi:MAG TPA: hypothetical protein VG497_30645 [Kribbella sp.]|nr:hypothetical protein [Kribbella sp.]
MVAPAVASVASGNSNSASYAVSVPVGTADGDLLIGVVASDFGTSAGNSFPAGWTALTTSTYDGGTDAFHVKLYARVASSEPATYTISHDNSDSVAAILRITGWDSAAGIAGAVKQVAPSTTGTGTTAPSLTPFGADDLLLTFHGAESSSGGSRTWTPPTGMTEDIDRQSTVWASLEVNHLANPATPSGTKVATPSASVDTGAACTISVKATGGSSNVSGTLSGNLPAVTGTVSGSAKVTATTSGTLPAVTGTLTAAARISAAATGTLPGLTGSFTANARASASVAATLPGLTGALTATARATGTITGDLPALTAALTGDVSTPGTPVTGTLSATLPSIQGGLSGAVTVTATAAGQLPAFTAAMTAAARVAASLNGSLQAIVGALTGTAGPPAEYSPLTDPASSIRPNPATALPRDNTATAVIRANTAEAAP